MRILKAIGTLVGLLLFCGLMFVAWTWWKSIYPRRPDGWPAGSVFIQAPHTLSGFLQVGGWVSCRLDADQNVDKCKFANYKGELLYEGEYTTCDDRKPLHDEELLLGLENQSYSYVRLKDSTVLYSKMVCD